MTMVTVPDNVEAFIEKAADLAAAAMRSRVLGEVRLSIQMDGIESPIEQLFYTAMLARTWADGREFLEHSISPESQGVHLKTQQVIGEYRVDFVVQQRWLGPDESPVVIELDGHAFHDTTKEQRAYEKGRDRYLVGAGYRVLHYTGSEIFADPFAVVHEVFGMLTIGDNTPYDPSNPMGI